MLELFRRYQIEILGLLFLRILFCIKLFQKKLIYSFNRHLNLVIWVTSDFIDIFYKFFLQGKPFFSLLRNDASKIMKIILLEYIPICALSS